MMVFTGVLILRIITATNLTSGHAKPKVYPGITQPDVLFAELRVGCHQLTLDQIKTGFLFFCCWCRELVDASFNYFHSI